MWWVWCVFSTSRSIQPCWRYVWGYFCSSPWFAASPPPTNLLPDTAGDAATTWSHQQPRANIRCPRSALSSTWPSSKVPEPGLPSVSHCLTSDGKSAIVIYLCLLLCFKQKYYFCGCTFIHPLQTSVLLSPCFKLSQLLLLQMSVCLAKRLLNQKSNHVFYNGTMLLKCSHALIVE